jgi:hypothetical protein
VRYKDSQTIKSLTMYVSFYMHAEKTAPVSRYHEHVYNIVIMMKGEINA